MSLATRVKGHHALAAAGALLLLAGAWSASAAYGEPTRHVEAVETSAWTERSAFSYAVSVTRNASLWPVGTVLPMGEPAYFRTVSGGFEVGHAWVADLPSDARGVAASQLHLQVLALDPTGRAYWTIDRPLAESRTETIHSGVSVEAIVDMDALVHDVAQLNLELPAGEGDLEWSIRAIVVYAFESQGRQEQGRAEHTLPIRVEDPRFILPPAEELIHETPHARTRQQAVVEPAGWPGVLRSLGSLTVLGLGAALLASGALLARRTQDGAFGRDLRRYKDFVSVASAIPPTARNPYALVDVATLEDLVHLASDARTRVLLDESSREFYALLPGMTYRYAGHARSLSG